MWKRSVDGRVSRKCRKVGESESGACVRARWFGVVMVVRCVGEW